MAVIYLPTPLRRHVGGQAKVTVAAGTVGEALAALQAQYPALRPQLSEESGEIRTFINVFVNGTEIRHLQGGATQVGDDDEISIIPAMAGGAGRA